MNHTRYREGDEFYCPKCGKRWAANEVPPVCASHRRQNYLKYISQKFPVASKGQK
jgi:uncharacterized Zn ribbon protein